jgi:hypothetical protein
MCSNLVMALDISPVDAFSQPLYHPDCLGRMRRAYTLPLVPAKELTPEQKADAKRLKAAFKAWQAYRKAQGLEYAQEVVTDGLGFGQSALSQYLNGHIPLNGETLRKLCTLIGVNPGSISPSIVEAEVARAKQWLPNVVTLPVADERNAGLRKRAHQKVRSKQQQRG